MTASAAIRAIANQLNAARRRLWRASSGISQRVTTMWLSSAIGGATTTLSEVTKWRKTAKSASRKNSVKGR